MRAWSERAMAALEELASVPRWFGSDDLRERVGQPDPAHHPNAGNNAVGSVIRMASARGIIKTDGRVMPSKQKHRKGGGNRRWIGAQWFGQVPDEGV